MRVIALVLASSILLASRTSNAIDHIWTIGGGYAPDGNQASLEANVVFFQRVVADTHSDRPPHRIQFADGSDPTAD
jgi:hypothetical protein